jgi:hypothetical protein
VCSLLSEIAYAETVKMQFQISIPNFGAYGKGKQVKKSIMLKLTRLPRKGAEIYTDFQHYFVNCLFSTGAIQSIIGDAQDRLGKIRM